MSGKSMTATEVVAWLRYLSADYVGSSDNSVASISKWLCAEMADAVEREIVVAAAYRPVGPENRVIREGSRPTPIVQHKRRK